MQDNFLRFVQRVAQKIGSKNAFDLSRDAKFNAIHDLLIKKGITTKAELNQLNDLALDKLATQIESMPPLPTQTTPN